MSENPVYDHLNNEWKRTCKVVLGGDVGELKDYEKWLLELKQPRLKNKSALSGKEVVFSSIDYNPDAKCVSFDETDFGKKFEPLTVNEIKDVESMFGALRERFYYCGNIVLGNSQFVEKSSSVSNSHYVYESARIHESKNVAYSTIAKNCENIFGCNVGSFSNYDIRCHQHGKGGRKFEAWLTWMSSDCYYTYNLLGCNDCFFSFNLRSKRNVIGNFELPKEKYLSLKDHLLEQLRDILKQRKRAPSLAEIVNGCGTPQKDTLASLAEFAKPHEQEGRISEIEKAFSETTSLVLGKSISGLKEYESWLKRHIVDVGEVESVLGSGKMPVPNYENYHAFDGNLNRFVNLSEAGALGEKLKLSESETEKIDFSNASAILKGIAFLYAQFHDGVFNNVIN